MVTYSTHLLSLAGERSNSASRVAESALSFRLRLSPPPSPLLLGDTTPALAEHGATPLAEEELFPLTGSGGPPPSEFPRICGDSGGPPSPSPLSCELPRILGESPWIKQDKSQASRARSDWRPHFLLSRQFAPESFGDGKAIHHVLCIRVDKLCPRLPQRVNDQVNEGSLKQ